MTGRAPGGTLVAPPAADIAGLEAVAGRLAGRVVRLVEVLSVRADRAGAGAVVVAVVRPEGPGADRDPVVLKSGPPALVAAGARAQRYAHVVAVAVGSTTGRHTRCDLAVPRVLRDDAAGGRVLMERATGARLADLLRRDDLHAARRTGAALAGLHSADAGGLDLPVRDLAGCLADLVLPQPEHLATVGLERRLVAFATGTADAVLAAAHGHPAPARLVHRDVHAGQVLLDEQRTWLLDWDLAAAGDPAVDVGNLVGTIRAKYPPARAEAAVEALLDGYLAGDTTGVLGRLAVHEAFTYLRLACKRARLHGPAAAGTVEDLLTRARLTLAAAS